MNIEKKDRIDQCIRRIDGVRYAIGIENDYEENKNLNFYEMLSNQLEEVIASLKEIEQS